jgi:hypothetical protein
VHEIEGAERDLLAKRDAVQSQAFATAYMMTIVGGAGTTMRLRPTRALYSA